MFIEFGIYNSLTNFLFGQLRRCYFLHNFGTHQFKKFEINYFYLSLLLHVFVKKFWKKNCLWVWFRMKPLTALISLKRLNVRLLDVRTFIDSHQNIRTMKKKKNKNTSLERKSREKNGDSERNGINHNEDESIYNYCCCFISLECKTNTTEYIFRVRFVSVL